MLLAVIVCCSTAILPPSQRTTVTYDVSLPFGNPVLPPTLLPALKFRHTIMAYAKMQCAWSNGYACLCNGADGCISPDSIAELERLNLPQPRGGGGGWVHFYKRPYNIKTIAARLQAAKDAEQKGGGGSAANTANRRHSGDVRGRFMSARADVAIDPPAPEHTHDLDLLCAHFTSQICGEDELLASDFTGALATLITNSAICTVPEHIHRNKRAAKSANVDQCSKKHVLERNIRIPFNAGAFGFRRRGVCLGKTRTTRCGHKLSGTCSLPTASCSVHSLSAMYTCANATQILSLFAEEMNLNPGSGCWLPQRGRAPNAHLATCTRLRGVLCATLRCQEAFQRLTPRILTKKMINQNPTPS